MRIKSVSQITDQHRKTGHMVPLSAQQTVPVTAVSPDGIFQMGGCYSRSWRFTDINYAVASREHQKELFFGYCDVLNALDPGSIAKITINNRRLNRQDFARSILIPLCDDDLDTLRQEYNDMLLEKAQTANNNMMLERYITITAQKRSLEEARNYFARVSSELATRFHALGSTLQELDRQERLRVFHDFLRGHEEEYNPDWSAMEKWKHSFKNYICPDNVQFMDDCFRLDDRYGRAIQLREYANYLKDDMISELCELNRTLMLSIDILPVPMDEAIRASERVMDSTESNIYKYLRKMAQNSNFVTEPPYEMKLQQAEAKEFLDDLRSRDQRMMFAHVTLVHLANTPEELKADTEALLAVCRKHLCQASVMKLRLQQLLGLQTALPYGLVKNLSDPRTMTTDSVAVLMPFRAQDVLQSGGTYYGVNAKSRNIIVVERAKLLNGNGFITGVPGSGKSFSAKREIAFRALASGDDVIAVDPQGEFGALFKRLGGEVIRIGPGIDNHINPLDLSRDYDELENPLGLKADFILSLCEQFYGGKLTAKMKSIIDRCVTKVYKGHIERGFDNSTAPTLNSFYSEIMHQRETEAKDLGLALELYAKGSMDTFAQATNVDVNNRLVVYDIKNLGRQLMTVGMLVVLDAIFARISHNHKLGRRTWVYIDEIYLLFNNAYSAAYLQELWKKVRKYGGCMTGITQNVEDCLRSDTARTMLANSEFLIMLNQAATDRMELAKLLNISDTQLSYITNSGEGQGLLRCGGSLLAFEDRFPKDTELYRLMTTKIDEMNA